MDSSPEFDVLINCSQADKAIGGALCAALEVNGFRCWYLWWLRLKSKNTYREYAWRALDQCRSMVHIHSKNSVMDEAVGEVRVRAACQRKPVVGFRIDDVEEFTLLGDENAMVWLDASDLRMEEHFKSLARLVEDLLPGNPRSIDEEANDLLLNQQPVTARFWNEVLIRYRPLVKEEVARLSMQRDLRGAEDELINHGMLGLIKAVHAYEPDGRVSFSSFARARIRKRLITVFHISGRS